MDTPKHVPLPDLTRMPIGDIRLREDAALGRALRQVLASLDDPNGVISAFQSSVLD